MDGMNNPASDGAPPHDPSMESRTAVLEEIAATTKQAMSELWLEVRNLRSDTNRRIAALRDAVERDFRMLFGTLITVALGLAAIMAKGFHWF
jgi:hypothetical protein